MPRSGGKKAANGTVVWHCPGCGVKYIRQQPVGRRCEDCLAREEEAK